jgi:DNA-directed RNA polymerase specialized sigma24 family protein
MRKDWKLTQQAFDSLLAWLSPDREEAGRKYEEIRSKLLRFFASRNCQAPEELADETFNRAADKLPEIAPGYVGDKARYFYGIAKKISLEATKPRPKPIPTPHQENADERERWHQCLERCLAELDPEDSALALEYYSLEGQAKIELHRKMAAVRGLTDNALKIRIHRLRKQLHACVPKCLNL